MVMYRRYSLFMLYGKPFRTGLDSGWVKHCAERFVQPRHAGDGGQPPLVPRHGGLLSGLLLLAYFGGTQAEATPKGVSDTAPVITVSLPPPSL